MAISDESTKTVARQTNRADPKVLWALVWLATGRTSAICDEVNQNRRMPNKPDRSQDLWALVWLANGPNLGKFR